MTKYAKLRSTHIIVKCILGIIILSLILTTMNTYTNQNIKKYIATVNGEKISFNVFQNMYSIEQEKQKKILGEKFFQLNKNKQFKKETYNYILSQLINNVLLEQYAKKIKSEVDDDQIKEIILNSNLFQKNKKFNKGKYFDYLASVNLTHNEYIDLLKKKLNTEHLINAIIDSNFILEQEKLGIIKLLSQKRTIKKATVNLDFLVKKQNVKNSEIQNYFYKHKNDFYIPKKFKVDFAQIKLKDFKIKCNENEITQWYEKNIKKYSTKEKRRYSIIQIKNKNDGLLILSQLYNENKDFSKIAENNSTDPISSKRGGDIGWIYSDSIPDEIKKSNLNQENQISDIIPFHNEFLIIKLNKIEKSHQKKLSEVYETIKKEIQVQKSLYLYNKIQKEISNVSEKNSNELDQILKKNNIPIQNTDWFDKNSIPDVLNISALKKIIFSNKKQSYSHFVILKNNQSFLIRIKDFKNKKMQVLNDVKEEIKNKLKNIKAIKEAKKISKKIISELEQGNMNLFKKFNLHFNNSETISRYDDNPITSIIFSLPHPKNEKKIYTLYQDQNKKIVIILLDKVYDKNFSKKEENIITEYLEKNYIESIFNCILNNLRETSIIKYEKIEGI